jgi:hypothetical protein
MGQYYVIANLDKREFLDPHTFGNGVKLMEFGMDGRSTLTGLAVLLASSNGQGGGDLHLPPGSAYEDVPGRWAGDRVVIAGDYDDIEGSPGKGVYDRCGNASPLEELANTVEPTGTFTDISHHVLGCLLEDNHFRSEYLDVESTNATWAEFIKKNRREAWQKARPNDELPASLV